MDYGVTVSGIPVYIPENSTISRITILNQMNFSTVFSDFCPAALSFKQDLHQTDHFLVLIAGIPVSFPKKIPINLCLRNIYHIQRSVLFLICKRFRSLLKHLARGKARYVLGHPGYPSG